jgi:hypothetical protein
LVSLFSLLEAAFSYMKPNGSRKDDPRCVVEAVDRFTQRSSENILIAWVCTAVVLYRRNLLTSPTPATHLVDGHRIRTRGSQSCQI